MTVVEVIALCMAAVVIAAMLCAVAVIVGLWWTRRHPARHAQRSITNGGG